VAAAAKKKDARVLRDRARAFQARQQFNTHRERRRVRDNLIGGIVGGVLLIAAIGAQVGYYASGPGRPTPAPSATVATPTPSTTAPTTPAPTVTP
jgi:hypothetical protein